MAVLGVVSVGGVLGSLARYGVAVAVPHSPVGFPWSTVLVNVIGSAGIGAVMAVVGTGARSPLLRPLVGVGFLGGFTTFSTAMLDLHQGLVADAAAGAVTALALTWVAALMAVWVGWVLGGRIARRPGPAGHP